MLEHAFRKRFETIVKLNKEIPVAVAEKLIGHKAYYDDRGNHIQLDENYVVPEVERLFEFFEHAISELTIDNSTRKQAELDQMKQNQSEYEKEKMKFNNLIKDFEGFKEEMTSFIKEIKEKERSNG